MLKIISKLSNIRLIIRNRVQKHFGWLSDAIYLRILYYAETGEFLHLKKPKTFNEKLQWLKLNDRKKIHTDMVDKYAVKEIVSNKIGAEYVIPTIGIWERFEDIPIASLPDRFVIKTTHGGGGNSVEVVRNKKNWDIEKAKIHFTDALSRSIWKNYREWPYKDVPRKIIIEKYIEDESGELMDYKIFCFNGTPRFLKVDFNRFIRHQANYYDLDWNVLPFGEAVCPPDYNYNIAKPANFDLMLELARKLSEGTKFLRVDLYNSKGKIYFGEMTFYPASGMGSFTPKEWDSKLGKLLDLNR